MTVLRRAGTPTTGVRRWTSRIRTITPWRSSGRWPCRRPIPLRGLASFVITDWDGEAVIYVKLAPGRQPEAADHPVHQAGGHPGDPRPAHGRGRRPGGLADPQPVGHAEGARSRRGGHHRPCQESGGQGARGALALLGDPLRRRGGPGPPSPRGRRDRGGERRIARLPRITPYSLLRLNMSMDRACLTPNSGASLTPGNTRWSSTLHRPEPRSVADACRRRAGT